MNRLTSLLFVLIPMLAISTTSTYASGQVQLDKLYETHSGESNSGIDISGMKNNIQDLGVGAQDVGIALCVLFFIVGWIIIVLAEGLKHPEYLKWGRGTLIATLMAYICIKFGPIILYNL